MLKEQSLTITGLIVVLLAFIFQRSGVEIGPEKLQATIEVLVELAGLVMAWYGRYRKGDISISGQKR